MISKDTVFNEKVLARIPKDYRDCSLDNFEGKPKLINSLKEHLNTEPFKSLVFYGKCGCGKTHLAVAIIKELIRKGKACEKRIADKTETILYALKYDFVSVPDLLLKLRSSFKHEESITEEQMINNYSTTDYLVLDDLGAEKTTEYSAAAIYLIIDNRYKWQKPTIITSNLTMEELEEKIGSRVASRLCNWRIIEIDMPDYRKIREK